MRGVGADLPTAQGIVLRTDSVLEPDGFGSATDADHGEGTVSTAEGAVVDLANNEGAGLLKGDCCGHLREVREKRGRKVEPLRPH